MKKTAFAFASILALSISVVAGVQGAKATSGTDFPFVSGVFISSPLNRTYTSGSLTLNVSSSGLGASNIHMSMNYSLDGTYSDTIPIAVQTRENSFVVSYVGTVALPELSQGSHSLTVYSEYTILNAYQNGVLVPEDTRLGKTTVHFTISGTIPAEETIPPVISNLSLENRTYTSTELPLRFSFNLDKTVSWLAYCLDNQENRTLSGWYSPDIYGRQFNVTLTGLSEGSHSVVVYANNTAEFTGVSDTMYFSVASSPSPSPTPIPTESPAPTPQKTTSPTPTPSPSLSPTETPSPSPTQQPAQTPEHAPESTVSEQTIVYATTGTAAAITLIAATTIALRKRLQQ